MRRLVRSHAYAPLLEQAAVWLRAQPESLIVAPSRAAADDLVRRAPEGLAAVHRFGLTGLAVELATPRLARNRVAPLSGLSVQALTARVIHRIKDSSLPYFAPVANTPGLARAVSRTVRELRMEQTAPEPLADTGAPGRDLALIAREFDRALGETHAADAAILFREAIAAVDAGEHRLAGLPLLLLDLQPEHALQRALIAALARRAPALLALALSSDSGLIERTLGLPPEDGAVRAPERTLDRVRASLFIPCDPVESAPDDSLEYFSAATESLECVEIARRMQRLARAGVPFDEMAVLLRTPERYQALLEEALRRAGVPAWFSRGVARPDPAGRALVALLWCAAERCSATRFAEYLSLGQAPREPGDARPALPDDEVMAELFRGAPEETPAPADSGEPAFESPAHWERLLVDAAVIGGRARWERRLRGLENEYRVKRAAAEDDAARLRLDREIDRLAALERFALPLVARLDALRAPALWRDWIERLEELAAAALREPATVLAVLEELRAMDDVGPASLEEVIGVLSERLLFLRREPPGRRYGRVFVGAVDEARGRTFRVVFLPGLAEGQFPRKTVEDPVLLDEYRLGLSLRRKDDRVASERGLLRVAAAAAGERLVFCFPRMDVVQSRPRVPSFYALEIVRAAHGRLPELREFEENAAAGAPSRLDWPSPADPSEAIDAAEYDIAALGRALAANPAAAPAAAAYLLHGRAPLVIESLRTRWRRWSQPKWTESDGLLRLSAAAQHALEDHRLSARAYSVSELQRFASCPYQFALYAILRLRPRDQAAALEQMDPITRGHILHRAQFAFFRKLETRGGAFTDAALLELADACVDEAAAVFEEQLAPAIDSVWKSEIDDLRTDLRGWVLRHYDERGDWEPARFEFAFGLRAGDGNDPRSVAAEAILEGGVRLRGAIDLIERHTAKDALRITDHKTGKVPEKLPDAVGGGSMLQPIAYALAAEKLLGSPVEWSRLFYCTQRGGFHPHPIEVNARRRRTFARALEIIDAEVARGWLPAAPAKDACQRCDFRPVCGPYEENRVRRKAPEGKEGVNDLRNLE